uniref:Solute carrier family 35 member F6 n=1 Tax=Syphacia muris TaxID=451379 RepID=A0A0N5ADW8_9BILA
MDYRHNYAVYATFLAVMLVSTGSINTIAAKWADNIKVDGKLFDHPFVQAICMFIGEFSCLLVFFLVFWYKKRHWAREASGRDGQVLGFGSSEPSLPNFNAFLFAIPACCDVVGTSLMYVGLNLTQASSYQMLRGAVIIFTGLFSVAFLGSRLQGFKWIGMILVTIGLIVVGVTDLIFGDNNNDDVNGIITGDLLIVMAQIATAVQVVVEQKVLKEYDVPPLLAVGLEGLFGMTVLTFLLIPMFYIHVPSTFSKNPYHRLEDIFDAFRELRDNPMIGVALGLTIVSIAFFNFFGITVTKELSATTRMVLDSVRTLVVWAFSLYLFDQKFISWQLIGFALLILGMFIYNDIYFGPLFRRKVLPRLGGFSARCCISFCGVDIGDDEGNSLLDENEEE